MSEESKPEPIKFYTQEEVNSLDETENSVSEESSTGETLDSDDNNVYNVDDAVLQSQNNTDTSNDTSDTSSDSVANGETGDAIETSSEEKFSYANDSIRQLDEWAKKNPNLDIREALELQATNIDELGDSELMLEALSKDNVGMSEEYLDMKMSEFDVLFLSDEEIRAKIDDPNDALTEREFKKLYMESEQLVSKGRTYLTESKESFNVNVDNKPNQQQVDLYQNGVKESLKDYKEETIRIGDTDIKFSVDDAIRKNVESIMMSPETLWNKYVNEKGDVNYEELRSDMLWLSNKDKVSKIISDQFKTIGKEEVIKSDKNIDFKPQTNKNPSTGKSTKQALYEAYRKATGGF